MEELTTLTQFLSEIKKITRRILQSSLIVMKNLNEDDAAEMIDDVVDADPKLKRHEALDLLQVTSLKWVQDAEVINNEIDDFIVKDSSGHFTVNEDVTKTPFLTSVWLGDTYDKPELDGLKALLKDLQMQLSCIDMEKLVATVVKVVKDGKSVLVEGSTEPTE